MSTRPELVSSIIQYVGDTQSLTDEDLNLVAVLIKILTWSPETRAAAAKHMMEMDRTYTQLGGE